MKWLESLVAFLVPSILIEKAEWRARWDIEQNESFVRSVQIAFPIVAAAFIANHFFYDRVVGLDHWIWFRLSMAAFLLLLFWFYTTSWSRGRFYRFPAFLGTFVVCTSQAWVQQVYGEEAWVFFFGMVLVSTFILRLSSLEALIWCLFNAFVSSSLILTSGLETAKFTSGVTVTTLAAVVLRGSALTDARLFLSKLNQEAAQNRVVEISEEFAERIKSFIPKVIADRLSSLMDEKRLTVVEASVEALKARKKAISCIFTDIRGYTHGSKDLDGFIGGSVLPEVSACSETIEMYSGIPRKVGDLIFAYFDDDDVVQNALRALVAGIEVARINETMNATSSQTQIRRYILISTGVAYVGNFGGLDSSIEITALGTPVNYLSRVDDLTKAPALAKTLKQGDLLLDEATVEVIRRVNIKLNIEEIDLDQMELEIRDFPEVKYVYRLTPTDEAHDELVSYTTRI